MGLLVGSHLDGYITLVLLRLRAVNSKSVFHSITLYKKFTAPDHHTMASLQLTITNSRCLRQNVADAEQQWTSRPQIAVCRPTAPDSCRIVSKPSDARLQPSQPVWTLKQGHWLPLNTLADCIQGDRTWHGQKLILTFGLNVSGYMLSLIHISEPTRPY